MIRHFRRFLALLTVAVMAWGAPNAVHAQNAGSTDSEAAAGDSKPAAKPPKARQRVTLKLPDEYRSKDKDKDGQIGMYEWPRNDYANFRRLDLNGDGFITPQELSRAGKGRRSSSPEVVVRPGDSASTTTATAATGETAADETPAVPGVSRSEAERQFDLVDKDKNGKVTEEEFQKSIVAKMKFKNAGVALSFPVGRDEFLRLYPAAK